MDCCCVCCHGPISWMWGTILTSIGVMLGGGLSSRGSTAAAQTAENTSAALDVLRKSISVAPTSVVPGANWHSRSLPRLTITPRGRHKLAARDTTWRNEAVAAWHLAEERISTGGACDGTRPSRARTAAGLAIGTSAGFVGAACTDCEGQNHNDDQHGGSPHNSRPPVQRDGGVARDRCSLASEPLPRLSALTSRPRPPLPPAGSARPGCRNEST